MICCIQCKKSNKECDCIEESGGAVKHVIVNFSRSENEDFYFENGNTVFTEAYHLKRGYCCTNNCRHCPY